MLDAFIIEKIRREREEANSRREELRISIPEPDLEEFPDVPPEISRERGVVEIDNNCNLDSFLIK
ncbi:MAG: hypothetical protein VX519_01125 [Myxococcota bacterium]|nr:hypothetical protein [Myxococcota bacterium]